MTPVPLAVLYAVGLTETGRRGSLQPFALNIEGPSFFAATLNEALRQFEEAQKRGAMHADQSLLSWPPLSIR
jgi:hypothetical protein